MVNDDPIVLSGQNGIHRFEELPESELPVFLDDVAGVTASNDAIVLDDRRGWQFLVTKFGTQVIGAPKSRISLRHFVLQSSFLSAKWLCQKANFELTPEPLPE